MLAVWRRKHCNTLIPFTQLKLFKLLSLSLQFLLLTPFSSPFSLPLTTLPTSAPKTSGRCRLRSSRPTQSRVGIRHVNALTSRVAGTSRRQVHPRRLWDLFFAVSPGSSNSVGKDATSAKGGLSRILASPTQGNLLSWKTRRQPRARPWAPAAVSRGTALYAGCWVGTRVRGARRSRGPSVTRVDVDVDRMARVSGEDEAMLQAMLRQLFQSVKEKITGAPSLECAEEILLHLEETDENFHK